MGSTAFHALLTGSIACVPSLALAQDTGQDKAAIEDLKKKLAELDSKHSDEIDDLKFQIETLEKEVAAAKTAAQTKSGQSNNVFNPQITVFGDFIGRVDNQHVYAEDDPTLPRVDDQFNLRETEFDFRAPIDPWSDAVVILSVESPSPNEFETSIEEGYFTLKKLPFLDSAPAGLKLQVGRFHQDFGRFNMTHLHDLPQPNYPRSLTNFLGNDAYVQDGIGGQFFLPSPSESSTLQANFALLDGGNIPIDPANNGANQAGLGRVEWFGELTDSQNLDLGVSAWSEDADHSLYGLDATYKWKPLAGGEWHSFLLGGELFSAALDDPSTDDHPMGFYVWSQYQFTQNVYLGVRYDRAEEVVDSSLVTNTYGTYLTYYTTEFLRFRLGLEHADSDVSTLDGRNTALIQMTMVFGSHPTEPYWVNH
jgi:hypothetical protein